MWILKGTLLGIWLFSYGTILSVYLGYRAAYRIAGRGLGMIGMSAIFPIVNPVFWLQIVVCLAGGLLFARLVPGKPALWIAFGVTELIPFGLLAMVLVLYSKLRKFGSSNTVNARSGTSSDDL